MATIKERAFEKYPKLRVPISGERLVDTNEDEREVYIQAATEQQEVDIEEACGLFRKLLTQFVNLLEVFNPGLENLIDVEKSITAFRKEMKGE